MRKAEVKELSWEGFHEYGTFAGMTEPDGVSVGPEIHEFFCDRIVYSYASPSPVGLSVSHVKRRPVIIERTEVHAMCGEVLMPLDGDVYIHVGHVSDPGAPDFEKFEIFRIPAGYAVCLKPGVWHFAAFPCEKEFVSVLVALPERTYANDCHVIEIPHEYQIELLV